MLVHRNSLHLYVLIKGSRKAQQGQVKKEKEKREKEKKKD